ncbi:hypothetical protein BO86DRAFT_378369 [Aspergillus japonicus CBS 114.51]|uniref:Uncharacterized protein n=1 Tax=Aspergillus japonicus CBS 114.51 TaxID=1448312 RepID=A0A8T8X487_ASPJA|nr:hypothetical protein BO86DRAFT_378369 [Aspergillus japonicus CBS 114.51]RAH82861.1 hypothetical protein BO86DRAFT_378369 [Aspergillus japonicus CBS 114.51]
MTARELELKSSWRGLWRRGRERKKGRERRVKVVLERKCSASAVQVTVCLSVCLRLSVTLSGGRGKPDEGLRLCSSRTWMVPGKGNQPTHRPNPNLLISRLKDVFASPKIPLGDDEFDRGECLECLSKRVDRVAANGSAPRRRRPCKKK